MAKIIDYKKIMQSASLNAIKNILLDVSENGLPGDHHFYITFHMAAEGVKTSDSLREKYPNEMTVVIQNWYENFEVTNLAFSITLNFNNIKETMRIPFLAIKSFVDPSVNFGLSFDTQIRIKTELEHQKNIDAAKNLEDAKTEENRDVAERKGGDVVSLESFRKS